MLPHEPPARAGAPDDPLHQRLRANAERLFARREAACAQAGRDPASVRLVAVTKYSTGIETAALAEVLASLPSPHTAPRPRLGESRVQDLLQKFDALEGTDVAVEWHLIGNLQRNKARSAVRHADVIHSLDRPEILDRVDAMARDEGRRVRGLLQFELSGDPGKHGFRAEDAERAFVHARRLEHVDFVGLMTMAGLGTSAESARPCFAALRDLRDRHAPEWPELSMGMSGDFEGAILEGATLVRIGTALFQDATPGEVGGPPPGG